MFSHNVSHNLSDNKALYQLNLNHKATGFEQEEQNEQEDEEMIEIMDTPSALKQNPFREPAKDFNGENDNFNQIQQHLANNQEQKYQNIELQESSSNKHEHNHRQSTEQNKMKAYEMTNDEEKQLNGGHHQNNHQAHKHRGFDPLKIPCDWTKAEMHARSRETKPELNDSDDNKEQQNGEKKKMQDVCDCCGYELERKKIGLTVNTMELGFMGAGFPLYFNYMKYCCFMLLSLFLIQGIPAILQNLDGTYCHFKQLEVFAALEEDHKHHSSNFMIPCPDSQLNKLSIANILDKLKDRTDNDFHYSMAAVIVQVFLSIFFRRSQRVIEQEVDRQNNTPSDYTIMVQNISEKIQDIEERLKSIFGVYGKIEKINLVYDITELEKQEQEIKRTIKKKQQVFIKIGAIDNNNSEIKIIEEEIEKLEEKVHKLEHDIKTNTSQYFVGTAFISFSREEEKQRAISSNPEYCWQRFKSYFNNGKSEKDSDKLYLDGRFLYISEAPEPNDIDWEFAHVNTSDKIKARLIAFSKWLLLTLFSFGVICMITYAQSQKTDHILEEEYKIQNESNEQHNGNLTEEEQHELDDLSDQKQVVTVLSFVISGIIVIWNKFFLPFLTHKICDHEKWSTKTNLNVSFAYKLTIGLFFNTALITFFVEIIFFKNIYAFAGGMIYNEFLVFLMNAIVPSLAWIIDPWKLYQDYKRNKARKSKLCVLTQDEANRIMEHPSYTMGKRYADIMKTMWFTFFYSPIIPIGTPISLIGLILYYFTDKYNLIHRRTVKESISSKLSMQMVELVEYAIIFHTFGQVFFKWFMCKNQDIGNFYLFIVVCVIVIIIPMDKINECIFPLKGFDEEKSYEEVVLDFDTDYDRENPVTKRESLIQYQERRNGIVTVVNAFNAAKKIVENAHNHHHDIEDLHVKVN